MTNTSRKWLLGASLLLCLVPSSFAFDPDPGRDHRKCRPGDNCNQQAPEGGSAAESFICSLRDSLAWVPCTFAHGPRNRLFPRCKKNPPAPRLSHDAGFSAPTLQATAVGCI